MLEAKRYIAIITSSSPTIGRISPVAAEVSPARLGRGRTSGSRCHEHGENAMAM